jgi:hypothetical protein
MYCRVYVAGEVVTDPIEVPLGEGKTINCFFLKTTQDLDPDGFSQQAQEIYFFIGLDGKANTKARFINEGCFIFAEGVLLADHFTGGPNLVPRKDVPRGSALSLRAYAIRVLDNRPVNVVQMQDVVEPFTGRLPSRTPD